MVVMTQAALDEFALANGFGKTTKAMNEQEKVALRYQFVMKQLSTASGDFQRTSDGWANQTKILSEQFNALKASIGQGLINALLPVVKVLNTLMAKLVTLGNLFSEFTSKIFGKAETSTKTISSSIDNNLSGIVDSANSASDAIGGVGESLKKASKQTFGFDELTTIQEPQGDASSGAIGGIDGGLLETVSTQEKLNEETSVYETMLDKLLKKAKELAKLFTKGFKLGLDTTNFSGAIESIKTSIESIKTSLMNIFSDGQVVSSFNSLIDNMASTLGILVGSAVGVATSVGNALITGIAQYLENNGEFLKEKFTNIMDGLGESVSLIGQYFKDVGQILADTFNSNEAATLVEDFISVIANPFLEWKDFSIQIFNDIFGGVVEFVSKYKEEITQGFKNTFAIVSDILNGAEKVIMDIIGILKQAYDTYVKPTLQNLGEKVNELMDKYIIPLGNTFVECWNKIADNLAIIWETWLKPFVKWFVDNLVKDLTKAINNIIDIGAILVGRIAQFIDGMIQIISGIIDFLVGVFTGDWDKVWQGIKDIFKGIWEQIKAILGAAIDIILNLFGTSLDKLSSWWNKTWQGIKDFFSNIFNSITSTLSNLLNNIINFAGNAFSKMGACFDGIKEKVIGFVSTGIEKVLGFKDKVLSAFENVKNGASNIFNGMKDVISNVFSSLANIIKTPINAIISIINKAIDSINGMSIDVPDWVPGFGGQTYGFSLPRIPQLANGGLVTQPTLAMVGEGREDEIVSPLSMLRQIENEGSAETNALLRQLIGLTTQLLNKDQDIYMDSTMVGSMITNYQNSENRRRG